MNADRAFRMLRSFWGDGQGFVFYATSKADPQGKAVPGSWKDHWFQWPQQEEEARRFLDQDFDSSTNVYFAPNLFTQKTHHKAYALGARWVWADMDGAPLTAVAEQGLPEPSIIFETSPGRYHAYWRLSYAVDPGEAEALCKGIAYAIGADKSGWDISQVLRVPFSRNPKYPDIEFYVEKLRWKPSREYSPDIFRPFEMAPGALEPTQEELAAIIAEADGLDGRALLRQWADQIPARARRMLTRPVGRGDDRSARLHELEMLLAEAGLPGPDILALVRTCPWNKFKGRVSEETQLAREVAKAIAEVESRDEPSDDDELPDDIDQIFTKRVDLMRHQLPPPSWLIEGWFPVGTQGIISAESGTFKSWMALDFAISVASGTPFLGQFPVLDPGAVLMIQEENAPNDVQGRIARIEKSRGLSTGVGDPIDYPFWVSNIAGFDLTNPDHRDKIELAASRYDLRLIILDPFYMMLGDADENSGRDLRPFINFARTFVANHPRTGLWIVHHTNKASANARANLNMRGHSSLNNWAGNTLSLSVLDPRLMTIQVERRFRSFPQQPLTALHWAITEEFGYEVTVDAVSETTRKATRKTTGETAEESTIRRLFIDLEDVRRGLSMMEVVDRTGYSQDGVLRAIANLVEKRQIVPLSEGDGAKRVMRYRMSLDEDKNPGVDGLDE